MWKCRNCGKILARFAEFFYGPEWVTEDGSKDCLDGGHVLEGGQV